MTGTLAHSYGADGAGSTLLRRRAAAGRLHLHAERRRADPDDQPGQDGFGHVLRVTLTNTTSGAYTVDQLAAIDHPTPGTRGEHPVHGQLPGHRRRRRHGDGLAVDRRRRRHADGHCGGLAGRRGRNNGHRDAGLRRRRRRRHGHPHRRHAAGVQPGRRRLLAGDRHRLRLHQGEGRRLVLVHGGRCDGPGCTGRRDLHGDGRRRRYCDRDGRLRGCGRQRADPRHGRGCGRRRRACRRQSGEHGRRPRCQCRRS